MIVVGIDPGTATTGYGFICETHDGLTLVEYGTIVTPAKIPPEERLVILHTQLTKLLLLHKPESGAVEKLFFQRNVTSALSVGQARGVILLSFAESAIPVFEYNPLEVKQAVSGYGGAEKGQVQQMVRAILGLEEIPRPDDAADALAIAICHLHSQKLKRLMA